MVSVFSHSRYQDIPWLSSAHLSVWTSGSQGFSPQNLRVTLKKRRTGSSFHTLWTFYLRSVKYVFFFLLVYCKCICPSSSVKNRSANSDTSQGQAVKGCNVTVCGHCLNDGICSQLEDPFPVPRKQVQLFLVKYKVRLLLGCNPTFFQEKQRSSIICEQAYINVLIENFTICGVLLFSGSVVSDSATLSVQFSCSAYQASLSFAIFWSLLKLMSIESVKPSNHLILCHPLLLPPSIFPRIRVFF